jgi:hypothetical protein
LKRRDLTRKTFPFWSPGNSNRPICLHFVPPQVPRRPLRYSYVRRNSSFNNLYWAENNRETEPLFESSGY